jgi:pimeloyl-ACP methyl ester carboxylesterase
MARIVAVHGIGHQLKGEHTLHSEWLPALRDGLARAGAFLPDGAQLVCAFYGDLFRPPGGRKGLGEPPFDASDVTEEEEVALLALWWAEASRVDHRVIAPDARTKLRTPDLVQRALNALSGSRYFGSLAERALIFSLKQVRAYLNDGAVRRRVQERVAAAVGVDSRIMIGHSLGSVIAYEALCAHPEWPVRNLVTLGSPLGIRNLIFDKLVPPPADGIGVRPRGIKRWMNIADAGDVVALVKMLAPSFVGPIEDLLVDNGAKAHDAKPYLTAVETGRAIAAGLALDAV